MFSFANAVDLPNYNVEVNGVVIPVLIDSGSTLNLINEHTYNKLKDPKHLNKSNVRIFAYQSKTPLPQRGKFRARVKYKSIFMDTTFYVISGQGPSILSKQTSEALNLLRVGPPKGVETINSIDQTEQNKFGNLQRVIEKYQDLFHGVGCYENLK